MHSKEEYLERCRQRWRSAIAATFPLGAPKVAEWTDLSAMSQVLAPFMGEGVNHAHFSTGGGLDLLGVGPSNERGFLSFATSSRARKIGKPERLLFHHFADDPAQSFFWLQFRKVRETGTYDPPADRDHEELVEIEPGTYLERAVWDQHCTYDEYGDEVPLPKDAKLIWRFNRGSIMLVGNGALWNGRPDTYDGEHDALGPDNIRSIIEGWIKQRHARGD